MSEYRIEIEKTKDCSDNLGNVCLNPQNDGGCFGLGQKGCPFQLVQEESCGTCGHKQECFQAVELYPDINAYDKRCIKLTHCSAYTPEVE